ncbi:hypothetical protein [Amycolatopsis sp. NPDC058986]|uniref:hypothetical protein n=1 Tax=unclassified Amycolatopsis TaxID=2618356 RepID=UPI00367232A7
MGDEPDTAGTLRPRRRKLRWWALAGGVVAVVATVWWAIDELPVDDAVARETLPIIDAHLRQGWQGMVAHDAAAPGTHWVCTERVIETRQEGDRLRIGLVASCDKLSRIGDELVIGSGYRRQPMVYVLDRSNGALHISNIELAQDGAGLQRSVERMFTWLDARKVLAGWEPEDPASVAPAAFGLPPGTAVRNQWYGSR